MVPLATPVVSQSGSWLCHSSVWPRMSWLFAWANATSWSAWDQSKIPCCGSTICHFIPLPGVTTENWLPAIAANEGVSMSCGISAVPMRRPIFAASARRELGSVKTWLGLTLAASLAPDGAAEAAVPVPSTAATLPAAPIARRLRRLICSSCRFPKCFGFSENFGANLSDNRTVEGCGKACQ